MVKFEERKVYSGYPADVKKEQGMEKAIIYRRNWRRRDMDQKLRVGILGATGMVGDRKSVV